jgi:hypothetical protein
MNVVGRLGTLTIGLQGGGDKPDGVAIVVRAGSGVRVDEQRGMSSPPPLTRQCEGERGGLADNAFATQGHVSCTVGKRLG